MKVADQKSPTKRKTGRPKGDGFHGILTESMMEQYGEKLFNFNEIAAIYGESKQNIHHTLKVNPELRIAFEKGQLKALDKLTSSLMKAAENGNMIACLFALKARFGWCEEQYRLNKPDKTEMPRVNIYLPDNGRDSINQSNVVYDAADKMIN